MFDQLGMWLSIPAVAPCYNGFHRVPRYIKPSVFDVSVK